MSDKVLRCAIYIRVSTAEQQIHGKSLEAQKEYLEHYAEEHGMTVSGVYADEGKTARKELKKRKAIHSLLQDVKGGKIDVILFWRLDRWFRNMSDFYKVQDILDAYNVYWISASEPGINMETRDGRLQLNVVLSIGQNEVDTTSERIKFVNEASIRQGKLIFGNANMPLGYMAAEVDGVKRMVKNPDQEEMVNAFFQFYRKHHSKSAAMDYIQQNYDSNFSRSIMRTMLSSEFYKGTYRGIPYCPAYLTEAEYAEIQQISNKNIKRSPSGRVYLFSGLIRCPLCGRLLCSNGGSSIINRKTREKRTYCYYRCNRAAIDKKCENHHRLSQNLVEQYLLDNLELEYEKFKVRSKKIAEQRKARSVKAKSPQQLQKELDRLNLLFQKGRIEWDYYNREYDRIKKSLEELSMIFPETERDFTHLDRLIKTDFRSVYASLSQENRRAFWRSIIEQIHIKEDYTVDYVDFV